MLPSVPVVAVVAPGRARPDRRRLNSDRQLGCVEPHGFAASASPAQLVGEWRALCTRAAPRSSCCEAAPLATCCFCCAAGRRFERVRQGRTPGTQSLAYGIHRIDGSVRGWPLATRHGAGRRGRSRGLARPRRAALRRARHLRLPAQRGEPRAGPQLRGRTVRARRRPAQRPSPQSCRRPPWPHPAAGSPRPGPWTTAGLTSRAPRK